MPKPLLYQPYHFLQASSVYSVVFQIVFAVLVMGGALTFPKAVFAQTANPAALASAPVAAKPAPAVTVKTPSSHTTYRPLWSELTPVQQQALAPLASNWNGISEAQKRKWLEISKNYLLLPTEGQAMVHSRMNEWVALSPQQRAQARLNFAKTKELSKELTPEEKQAKWQAYQALSTEEKNKLAAKASPKPSGAATAVKPVAPQKLTTIPAPPTKADVKPVPKNMNPPLGTGPIAAPVPSEAAIAGQIRNSPQR